jgi:hypothetical protein
MQKYRHTPVVIASATWDGSLGVVRSNPARCLLLTSRQAFLNALRGLETEFWPDMKILWTYHFLYLHMHVGTCIHMASGRSKMTSVLTHGHVVLKKFKKALTIKIGTVHSCVPTYLHPLYARRLGVFTDIFLNSGSWVRERGQEIKWGF